MDFTPWGNFVMQNLAWLIERDHLRVVIDGHTRSNLQMAGDTYTPWELSADRANAARRSLVHYAVDPKGIERVTGYADTRPVDGEAPDSEANQRITLSLSLSKLGDKTDNKEAALDPGAKTKVEAAPSPAELQHPSS
jgi:chemotaxis protein MotB